MSEMNGNDGEQRRVSALRELPREMPPPRDLWGGISAEIAKDERIRAGDPSAAPHLRLRSSRMQWLALAAVVSALAVGMWLGRNVLPGGGSQPPAQMASADGAVNEHANDQPMVAASYVTDSRYVKQRAAMVRALEGQLKALPVETQEKVAASLATIRASMTEIQAALGRDPGNALLQELLVNTYQDEMRVLTAVHEASDGQET